MYRGRAIPLLLDDCGDDEKVSGGFGSSFRRTGFNLVVRVRVSTCKISKLWERLSVFPNGYDGPQRTKLMAIPYAFAQSQDERLRVFCLFSLFRFPFPLPLLGVKAPVTRRGSIDTVSGDLAKGSPFLLETTTPVGRKGNSSEREERIFVDWDDKGPDPQLSDITPAHWVSRQIVMAS